MESEAGIALYEVKYTMDKYNLSKMPIRNNPKKKHMLLEQKK